MSQQTIDDRVHYQSREFCKDSKCSVQQELDRHEKGSQLYEQRKKKCRTGCKYSHEYFMLWMTAQDYVMESDGPVTDIFNSGTAWEFHDWLQQHDIKIVKRD